MRVLAGSCTQNSTPFHIFSFFMKTHTPLFFVRQVISYCLNDIEGESACFNCGGNNQELLLHHCPVGINDWSHVSVGNETQYEAVMSRIQGLSIGIVIVTTILLFLRVVLVLYISGAGRSGSLMSADLTSSPSSFPASSRNGTVFIRRPKPSPPAAAISLLPISHPRNWSQMRRST